MGRHKITKPLLGDTLRLSLGVTGNLSIRRAYGNLSIVTKSYLDRVEFAIVSHPDLPHIASMQVAGQGVLLGVFPEQYKNREGTIRSIYIFAKQQEDGTWLASIPRDTDGTFSYYHAHRTPDSEFADMASGDE